MNLLPLNPVNSYKKNRCHSKHYVIQSLYCHSERAQQSEEPQNPNCHQKRPLSFKAQCHSEPPMSFRARAAERRTSKSKLSSKTPMSFRPCGAKRGTSKINQVTIQRYFGHTPLCMTASMSFRARAAERGTSKPKLSLKTSMSFRARAAERRTSKINQTTIQRYFSRTSFCMTALMSFRARAAERGTSKPKLSFRTPIVIHCTAKIPKIQQSNSPQKTLFLKQ